MQKKYKILLIILLVKILMVNTSSVYSCENFIFKKATISLENKLKNKKKIVVELAETRLKRKQGLQCRKKMPKQEGMLFLWEKEDHRVFWMKKTYIPLDIIFFNNKKQIFHFFLNAKPLDENPILSNGKAKYVLELNAGEFKSLDLKLGYKLIFLNKN